MADIRDFIGDDITGTLDASVAVGDLVAFSGGAGWPIKNVGYIPTFTGSATGGHGSALARLTGGRIVEFYARAGDGYPCFRVFDAAMAQVVAETVVQSGAASSTNSLAILAMANGNFVIFWLYNSNPYFAIFSSAGGVVKTATAIDGSTAWNVDTTSGARFIAQMTGGNLVFIGCDTAFVYARYAVFDASGNVVAGPANVSTAVVTPGTVTVAGVGAGFAVGWLNGSNSYPAFRTFNSSGAAVSSATDAMATASSGYFHLARCATNYFAIICKEGGYPQPHARIYDANGAFFTGAGLSVMEGTPHSYMAATLANGDMVFGAMSSPAGGAIALRRWDAAANSFTPKIIVAPDGGALGITINTGVLSLAPTPDGGLVVLAQHPAATGSTNLYVLSAWRLDAKLNVLGYTRLPQHDLTPPGIQRGIYGVVATETQVLASCLYPRHQVLALNHQPIAGCAVSASAIQTSGKHTVSGGVLPAGARLDQFSIAGNLMPAVAISATEVILGG